MSTAFSGLPTSLWPWFLSLTPFPKRGIAKGRDAQGSADSEPAAPRARRTEARPLADLSDFQSAEMSDFGPALTPKHARQSKRLEARIYSRDGQSSACS